MARYRIGNDMTVVWSIYDHTGAAYNLKDKEVRLYYTCERGRFEVDFEIQGTNKVVWSFSGREQKVIGDYTLSLEIIESAGTRRIFKDYCNAFTLVGKSCEEAALGNPNISEDGNIVLSSTLDVYRIQPIIPTVGSNSNWFVNGTDTGKPSTGKSAYEYAKEKGYEGTESEYAESLKLAPENSEKLAELADEVASNGVLLQNLIYVVDFFVEDLENLVKKSNDRIYANLDKLISALQRKARILVLHQSSDMGYATLVGYADDLLYAKVVNSYKTIDITAQYGRGKDWISSDEVAISGEIKTVNGESLLGEGNLDIISDWDAREGEAGYVKNRPFYAEFSEDENYSERWTNGRLDVDIDGRNLYIKVCANQLNVIEEGVAPVWDYFHLTPNDVGFEKHNLRFDGQWEEDIFSWLIHMIDTESYDKTDIYIATDTGNIKQLPEVFVPNSIARVEQLEKLADEVASNGVLIEDLQNMKIDKENDDYYPKMAVGLADNLAGVDVVDSEINFRRSGGGAISDGVARIEAIKGKSVVWNQLRLDDTFNEAERNGVTLSLDGQCVVLNGTTTADTSFAAMKKIAVIKGHQYLISGGEFNKANYNFYDNALIASTGKNNTIFTPMESGVVTSQRIYCANGKTFNNYRIEPRLVDLTQMFGAGNEPTTIEEFYARIPMGVDLNAYNEGEVIHMDVQSVESQGVNAWDEEWEKGKFNTTDGSNVAAENTMRMKNSIKVLPNANYYCKSPVDVWMLFLDTNGEVIEGYSTGLEKYQNACRVKNSSFVTPSNAAYIRAYFNQYFASTPTYNHDICIHLSDTSINGNYYPYVKRVEDLSLIRKYFPDGMKSAGSAHDEIRYNKASGKWEKVVRIGEVDLGTLNWAYQGVSDSYPLGYFSTKIGDYKIGGDGLCIKYVRAENNWTIEGWRTSTSTATLYIKTDDYSDAASFKAAMQGVIFYYELAEPIVTELDAEDQFKDLDYQVWNAGTEKAIAEGKSAPLAADITYGFNAIGKIKELEQAIKALQTTVASL